MIHFWNCGSDCFLANGRARIEGTGRQVFPARIAVSPGRFRISTVRLGDCAGSGSGSQRYAERLHGTKGSLDRPAVISRERRSNTLLVAESIGVQCVTKKRSSSAKCVRHV